LPADEDVADGALARGHPVLVGQQGVQLLVQTVTPVGQSAGRRTQPDTDGHDSTGPHAANQISLSSREEKSTT